MRRRDFIALLGAVAWPATAQTQQSAIPVVGYVGAQAQTFYADRLRAFREGLRKSGFLNGRQVSFEYRWAEGHVDRLPELLSDLVARGVSVIALPDSTAGSILAKRMISTIPVVFGISADPVQLGIVESWNQPGGNITGLVLANTELVAKRMELLHQLTPTAKTIGLLVNPDTSGPWDVTSAEAAVRALGLELRTLNVTNKDGIAPAINSFAEEEHSALLVGSDTLFYVHREWIVTLAAQHRLMAIYDRREYVQAGGLISYGASLIEFHKQLGVYVGRILNGEKPGNLPVMRPTKFEIAINLKTARALGAAVPRGLLARADELIE